MSSRRAARRAAVDALYAADIRGEAPDTEDAADAFTHELVHGVIGHLADVDTAIGSASPDWPVSRLASVDRAILRVAAYELLYSRTPPGAVIDEAVGAATELSTEESGRFVNGVLRGVLEQVPQPGP